MSWLAWIVFGALAGWLASKVVKDPEPRGCLTNMIIGILGAVLGGFIYRVATDDPWNFRFSLASFGVAVLGSVALLFLISLIPSRRR